MPSLKQTLILLPLLGLVAAAPTNFARDLDTTDYGPTVLNTVGIYHPDGSWDANEQADADLDDNGDAMLDHAVKRRSALAPRQYVGETIDKAASTTGVMTGQIAKGVPIFFKKTLKTGKSFWSSFKGNFQWKRDVGPTSTFSKLGPEEIYTDAVE